MQRRTPRSLSLWLPLALGLAAGPLASRASAQESELPRLRAAAQAARRDGDAQRALGMALLRAGHFDEAQRQLTAASRLRRGSPEALFDVARVAFARGDHRAAESACRALGRSAATSPLADVCAARSDLVWNRSARAFEALNRALQADPNGYEALFALGEAHRLRAAVADAESAYQRASAQRPTDAEPYLGLGRLYVAAQRRDDAVRALERALELDAQSPDVQFELGRVLGSSPRALELLTQAVAGRPTWPEAQTVLGRALLQAGRAADAEAAFRVAIAERADHEPAHVGLADALAARSAWPEAEASYRRAIELVENDAAATFGLARVLVATDRVEEAYESFARAYTLDTRNTEPLLTAAELALRQQRDVLASGFLDTVLRTHSDDARALGLYGEVMRARGDRARAREYFERARQAGLDPARVEAGLRGL